jgi:hypothetical protein
LPAHLFLKKIQRAFFRHKKMIPDENYFSIKKSLKILNVWKNKIL